jgi:hypothetical protein
MRVEIGRAGGGLQAVVLAVEWARMKAGAPDALCLVFTDVEAEQIPDGAEIRQTDG